MPKEKALVLAEMQADSTTFDPVNLNRKIKPDSKYREALTVQSNIETARILANIANNKIEEYNKMRINILRITFEFRFPTIYDYQQVKNFVSRATSPSVRINMEDVTYYTTNNKLENSHSHIVIYNEPDNIIKQLDNKIEENRLR
jgi:hypothetical protein